MKNETKRDVFDDALRALEEFGKQGSGWEMAYDELSARYTSALQDDLPVIPKAVGEMLRSAHWQTDLLGVLNTAKNGYKISETLKWIYSNQDTFARAWLYGYTVEEDK